MNRPLFLSVAGRLVQIAGTSLIIFATLACTIQHTRDTTRTTLEELGLRSSVKVSRAGFGRLPASTKIFLSRTAVSSGFHSEYPRLRTHLDELLANTVQEKFPLVYRQVDEVSVAAALATARETGCDVLLYLNLRRMDDSSPAAENAEPVAKDRLSLVMYVMDVRSGRLLDTLVAYSSDGWLRWGEQSLKDLAEPSLQAMIAQLLATEIASPR